MRRILLVEDEAEVREVLREALSYEGHAVTACATWQEAAALLAAATPDAPVWDFAVIDLRLPDGDGTALADRAAQAGIACLLMTGDASDFEAPGAGHAMLRKPFALDTLTKAISRRLGG